MKINLNYFQNSKCFTILTNSQVVLHLKINTLELQKLANSLKQFLNLSTLQHLKYEDLSPFLDLASHCIR